MHLAVHLTVYVLTTALGILLVLFLANSDWHQPVAAWCSTAGGIATLSTAAGLFLAAPLIHFLVWWGRMLRSREISYTTDTGRIAVGLIAIEEALTRALDGEPEVKKAHVHVLEDRVKRTGIIDAVMTLWEVPNVTARTRFCQRLLRRRFAELMPEKDAVQVNLTVHRLNVRRPEDRTANATTMVAPPVPAKERRDPGDESDVRPSIEPTDDLYVGPTYPVSRDDDDPFQVRPPTTRVGRKKTQ